MNRLSLASEKPRVGIKSKAIKEAGIQHNLLEMLTPTIFPELRIVVFPLYPGTIYAYSH